MATATKPRTTRTSRKLLEWSASTSGSPLTVDREGGVIKGVKVVGRHSRNSHGLREAVNGTEYTKACLQEALSLYEGVDVLVDHDEDGRGNRSSSDVFGKLKNVRLTEDGVRADLHFLKAHPLASRVCEDVERGLGSFGLSHDATAAKERIDRSAGRLVIEKLATVRSVDLVRKPASNRNLWESQTMPKTTLRELVESVKLTPVRAKWRKRLLEDDAMDAPMDAPIDAPAEGGSSDDALTSGFKAAMMAVIDDGSLDAAGKLAKLKQLLTTHEKLTQEPEPEEPKQESEDDDKPKDKDKSDDDRKESLKVKELEHRLAVRDLCEKADVKADKTLLETLESLPIESARRLVEREKTRGGSASPRSSGYGGGSGGGRGKGKSPTVPTTTKEFASSIRD